MSFEGYYQYLCIKGHLFSADAYTSKGESTECGYGDPVAWWNLVDVTNGSYCDQENDCEGCEFCDKGRIDNYVKLEILKLAVTEECDCCKHTRVVEEVRYKIPLDKGRKK